MEKINVGGQAVIEGVMMRAPRAMAIAVRRPTGEIVVRKEEMIPLSERYPVVKLPIVRGGGCALPLADHGGDGTQLFRQ